MKNPHSKLLKALKKNDLSYIREYVESGGDVDTVVISKVEGLYLPQCTLFLAAVKLGKTDIMNYLIEKGADVFAKDVHGNNALYHGISFGVHSVVEKLLSLGIDPYEKNIFNNCPKDLLLIMAFPDYIHEMITDYKEYSLLHKIQHTPLVEESSII